MILLVVQFHDIILTVIISGVTRHCTDTNYEQTISHLTLTISHHNFSNLSVFGCFCVNLHDLFV